jgi:ketosteroid isomerase-like protein
MNNPSRDDAAARAAVERFYAALESLITGHGTDLMKLAWHHTDAVTAAHPLGDWSYGWEEILATWEVVAGIGSPENGGSRIRNLQVRAYGDMAYSTCVFVAGARFGGATVNCTNVLVRDDGDWKIVHHHADKSREIEEGLETASDAASTTAS